MSYRDILFSKPISKIRDWKFDKKVVEVFPDMIQRSIPGYSNILLIIEMLTRRFVKPNSQVYDLGCSLGAVTLSVRRNINVPGCHIIAVDNSPAMIERCYYLIETSYYPSVQVLKADVRDISIDNASLVILNFTLQFLEIDTRLALLKKIAQGLNPGGALILSEKICFEDPNISELIFNMHHDFKLANGYSELEINQKNKMLKKIMPINSIETHKICLKNAGFTHIELCFQFLNFCSVLALK
ncbi:carboxy-S-adenosyl-L-methionine synthase CmoA [Pantoea sp. Aalb]|uniref:carboxy-S-adenosyl-L-methionine synthase CmoA n=1 Tax=Pantoea sp. Aalb TaxID=2576762 RepID=UPI00132A657F|nr:carboxy-S-adenosyl-L-methionine synthase CmoA [Pantoea sp. Aalb]MXP67357.1 carboxy-S-adenosyl-L-methionine synthase CmoA [Pantoea sp. Aalb]